MSKTWETEEDDVQVAPVKLGHPVKTFIVLVDSDKADWGIVEDTLGNVLWTPGKGEVIGTWSRPQFDGLFHISLTTSLSALQDRSIQTFAKYAEERRQMEGAPKKSSRKAKTEVVPAPELLQDISVEEKLKFNTLRARLGRAK